jgi:hypothetical protein
MNIKVKDLFREGLYSKLSESGKFSLFFIWVMKGLEGILINPVMAFSCDFGVHKSFY